MRKVLLSIFLLTLLPLLSIAQIKRDEQGVVKEYFRLGEISIDEQYKDNETSLSQFVNQVNSYDQAPLVHINQEMTSAPTSPSIGSVAESSPQVKERKPLYMAIKTNMLYDVLLVPNIGVEFYLGHNFSAVANWHCAWIGLESKGKIWRNYGGDIALRRWFGKQAKQSPLSGHHVGLYAQALTYDIHLNKIGSFAEDWNWSVGVEYGYSLPIARKLNLDFTLGLGYHWGEYHKYKLVDEHKVWTATNRRYYVGPTKCEVSLVWLIGSENYNLNRKRK